MSTTPLPPLAKSTPEQDDLFDHLYEYGVSAEGVHQRLEKVCQAYATAARADLEAEVQRLREALNDAATSLETIQLRSYGEDSNLSTMLEVRGYAGNRAKVARAALEKQP